MVKNMKQKVILKNMIKHFILITRHRWIVLKLCCRVGLPWRGIVHDLSKYSPTEFFESIEYYEGNRSPIVGAKKDKGYSEAWLHHKGKNKHHCEYWVDMNAPDKTPIMPYKYTAEMICDKLAAGIIYQGKNWNKEYPINYWKKEREKAQMNENLKDLLTDFFMQVSVDGIDKVLTKKNIRYYSALVTINS